MCRQIFMVIHSNNNKINCFGLFVVVYKLVNLICKCGVT